LKITAMVADKTGTTIIKRYLEGNARQAEGQGVKLAQMMLDAGAASLIAEMRCQ
jgi:porphobilinogen deaminase